MCWLQHAALLRHYPQFLLVVLAALGLVECVAGFRAWGFLRGINGLFLGAAIGLMVCLVLLHSPLMAIVGLIVGGIGGPVLFVTVEPIGAFFVGVSTGASFIWVLSAAIHQPLNGLISTAMAIAGLATAYATVVGGRRAIMILTALAGAQQLAATAMAYLYPDDGQAVVSLPEVGVLLLLAAAGLAIQFATNRAVPQSARTEASNSLPAPSRLHS